MSAAADRYWTDRKWNIFLRDQEETSKKGESKPKNEISSEIVVHCTGFRSPCMFYKRRSSMIA